jgi:hypothetical protein
MRPTITVAVLAAALLVPAIANAQEGSGFGRSGQVAITWDQSIATTYLGAVTSGAIAALGPALPPPSWSMLDIQYTTFNNNGGSATRFGLAPTLDYFVIDNLSIGAQLLFSIATLSPASVAGEPAPTSTTLTTFGVAPQVGYNFNIGEHFGFWPKVFFAYATISASNNGGSEAVSSLGIFAPFLYHPVSHFYLGLGPNFATQLGNSSSNSNGTNTTVTTYNDKATSLGVMTTFGGYFGG